MDEAWRCGMVVAGATGAALAAWPVVRSHWRGRAWSLGVLAALMGAAPLLLQGASVGWRGCATLGCLMPALALWDAILSGPAWRRDRFVPWAVFVMVPLVLVYRMSLTDPRTPRRAALVLALRSLVAVVLGAAILSWAFGRPWSSFWLEHLSKLVGFYLLALDGGLNLGSALGRLAGLRLIDASRDPVLARTPADFWRRYNREVGRFLWVDLGLPLAGRHRPMLAISIVFLASGLLHEWMAFTASGRVTGLQVLFFAVQGAATVATWNWRPTGARRAPSTVATLAFNAVTSILFFLSAETVLDWYSTY